jgi:hypothetical protein
MKYIGFYNITETIEALEGYHLSLEYNSTQLTINMTLHHYEVLAYKRIFVY